MKSLITPTMPWYCRDCKTRFSGPKTHAPKDGCTTCGGRNIFDVNVGPPIPIVPTRKTLGLRYTR